MISQEAVEKMLGIKDKTQIKPEEMARRLKRLIINT